MLKKVMNHSKVIRTVLGGSISHRSTKTWTPAGRITGEHTHSESLAENDEQMNETKKIRCDTRSLLISGPMSKIVRPETR